MILKRRVLAPAEQAAIENTEATAIANQAKIDYIAMMTDVEIPTEEGDVNNEPEV